VQAILRAPARLLFVVLVVLGAMVLLFLLLLIRSMVWVAGAAAGEFSFNNLRNHMDIRKYSVDETGVLALRDSGDEPMLGEDGIPMTITLYGPGSKQYARSQAAQQNRMIDKLKRKGKTEQSAEEKVREQAEFLAGCTKEFSSNIEMDALQGEALFKAVYSEPDIGFIAEQVGKHLGDWANFKKPSTTTSASTSAKAPG
jgi:hypothetical protein